MRKFIFTFLTLIIVIPFISACGSDNDEFWEDYIIRTDTTITNDTIIKSDTTIINGDTIIYKDTIINRDTIVKIDTNTQIDKRTIMLDFTTLSSNNIKVEQAFYWDKKSSGSNQGIAIFGDYLFQTYHTKTFIDVYDLKDKKLIFTIQSKQESDIHCNNADFSNVFYEEGDPFPLLYLEHRGTSHKTSVFRIVLKDGNYTTEKIQTINFSPCSWCITNNDNENNYMYISFGLDGHSHTAKINMPDYRTPQLYISLEPDSCLEVFDDLSGSKVGQDATIYKNKLFQLKGYSGEGEIRIIDLKEHKLIYVLNFQDFGISCEPEGIAWYKDHLVISTMGGKIYNIYFVE